MILPARRQAALLAARAFSQSKRIQNAASGPATASSSNTSAGQPPSKTSDSSSQIDPRLTGAARLLAEAIEEEHVAGPSSRSRDHLIHTQGPIWTGEESQSDSVLRMLVDAHKPLRTGEGIKHDASEDKIRKIIKSIDMSPLPSQPVRASTPTESDVEEVIAESSTASRHRTTIPPDQHRPWHATYTGDTTKTEPPKIKYGVFIKKKVGGDSLANILELQLPPGADAKTRARVRESRKRSRLVGRMENAREGALDYKLDVDEEGKTFEGNRQRKGHSVLGAGKGAASGLKAWAGLVEDRIQRAKEAGFFKTTKGHGKPLPVDPNSSNPHLEIGELLMNRIVKRQGALPPWIELQHSLDHALNSFRSTLLTTYSTHLTRIILSTNTLVPLPPMRIVPSRDEAWEAREFKFHEENIRQINNLVKRMNALAPAPARRNLYTLEGELNRVRGDVLREEVWEGVKKRAQDAQYTQAVTPSRPMSIPFEGGLKKMGSFASRSLSTIAHPVASVMGKTGSSVAGGYNEGARGSSSNGQANAQPDSTGQAIGLIVIVGAGIAGYTYFKPGVRADSMSEDLIPVASQLVTPFTVSAMSPSEPRHGILQVINVYIIEPIKTFFRFLHLFALFGPVIISAPMLLVGKPQVRRRMGKPVAEPEENWGAVWWYGFLVKQMERAGPSFIKLGQWAASRADLFPSVLCDKMSKLHSNGKEHSFYHTKRVVEKAFDMAFDDIFEDFDHKPIGCGAIAQVYKAKLKPEILGQGANINEEDFSTSVAIKVLHPRVRKVIPRDIAIMSIFANVINAIPGMQWISLPEEVEVFGDMMNSQLDLRVEANNLQRFNNNFKSRGRRIEFPRPIKLGKDLNGETREESKDILMEEFEDALPLKYFLRNGGGDYDDRIANIGLDAFLEMLLLDNFTHGDLHPGNIMVRFYKPTTKDYLSPLVSRFSKSASEDIALPHHSLSDDQLVESLTAIAHDPDEWRARLVSLLQRGFEPQLVFIDAGLVTSLDGTNRRNFLDLFRAVAEFDGYKAGKLMVERCRSPEFVIDEETFALKMQHLILSVKSKTFSLAKIKISDILTDVLTAVRQHHVKLEGDFVNTVISILLLEGIGRQLDPNMDLFKSALPILRQLGRQMGTREAISMAPKGNIWAMVKLWVWVEAREVAGQASAVDEWIRYDRMMPNI